MHLNLGTKTTLSSSTTLIAVSQSGETADTLAALEKTKSHGAKTIGVVNVVGSTIAREADCSVYIHAGPEIGVASTKAFTCQVSVLNLIALFLFQFKVGKNNSKIEEIITEIGSIADKIDTILSYSNEIKLIAESYKNANNFLYLGRGFQNIEKGEYDHFMLKEIFEQSTAFIQF